MIEDGSVHEDGTLVNRDIDPEAEWDDDKPYGRNITKYKDLSFNVMSTALRQACPSITTKANSASLRVWGQRVASTTSMFELIEHCSGTNGEDTIDPSVRSKRAVIDEVAGKIVEHKGRLKGLVLPAIYKKVGPFQIKSSSGDECLVKCKFTGESKNQGSA